MRRQRQAVAGSGEPRLRQPNQPWVTDLERHEAFFNRVVLDGHRHVLVAAGALKLRAA